MGSARRGAIRAALFVCAVVVLSSAPAGAAERRGLDTAPAPFSPTPLSHGPLTGHLPPVDQNLSVVGGLALTGEFGDVVESQIADLAVHEGYAYLNSWDEPSCTRGGTYIADIRVPDAPQEIGFIPAQPGYYHGEGAHVVSLDTPEFAGDLLAVNDEACTDETTRPDEVAEDAGGFDLYDVSDPSNPVTLVQNAGDFTADGVTEPADEDYANSYHSVFVWQDGPNAYLVGVDNTELADIDIFDITDPRNPVFINDFDPFVLGEDVFDEIVDNAANANEVFHHDVVVKRVGDRMRMIASYWDAGYLQLDVTNPASPTYISDTTFDDPDPLTGIDPPEGNAHQSEFSHDNQFILAADEDFASHRLDEFEILTGDAAGVYPSQAVPGAAPINLLEDGVFNGPTYYGGYGCPTSAPIPERSSIDPELEEGEEAIIVLQRGPSGDPGAPEEACFPGEKAQNAADAGWDAVLIANRHFGTAEDDGPDCGSGGFTSAVVAVCTTNEALDLIFGIDPTFEVPYVPGSNPALGAPGEDVQATAFFDGWGYAHLYDANTAEELDAFAIPEALDERFSTGFGDLSIHEFATDPTENLAYSSYYAGGIRVFSFGRDEGLVERGAWIGSLGSNFWGIEQFTTPDGIRLIAGSDRDYGLVILRYTGPGEPVRPSCTNSAVETSPGTAVSVPLTCTDANGNPLTRRIAGQPANGSLGDVSGDSVTYTPNAGFTGTDTFTFVASDGAADSAEATASVAVAAPSNRFRLRLGKLKNGRLILVITVEAPGDVAAGLRANLPAGQARAARSVRLARTSREVEKAGTVRLTLKLSKAKRRQLRRGLARSRSGRVRGRVNVTFTPTGGKTRRSSRRLTIR